MKIINKIEFDKDEIQTIIDALGIVAEIYNCDYVSHEVQDKADTAFDKLADLICLDPEGEKAYRREGYD